MKKVLVIGSVNVDHTTYFEKLPQAGETLVGQDYKSAIGGKGANQAVAASLSGADVTFLCAIGEDDNANKIQKELAKFPMKTIYHKTEKQTGIATILVNSSTGQNRIIIVPGSNAELKEDIIRKYANLIAKCDYLLLQLEIPMDSVKICLELAKKHNKVTILNPAPASHLSPEVLKLVDYFTPNESELETISEMLCNNEEDYIKAAQVLIEKGVSNVIVTRGEQGSLLINKNSCIKIPVYKVNAVDTTAAGDCYNGVFVSYLSQGHDIEDALNMASIASALAVTKYGAISSLPTKDEIEEYK